MTTADEDNKESMYNSFGFITKQKAIEYGFTHHAKYFGIPCFVSDEGEGMMVAAKWIPLEFVFSAFMHIEGFLRDVFYPEDEPGFQFQLFGKIE